jgi:Rps23 Pro-64 3,4-dihydroxylase Tpa1-like proline 4-hydroxylase
VIGTRRVSYIIYLTDPDDEWRENEGGALELYAIGKRSKHMYLYANCTYLYVYIFIYVFMNVL